jgi:hypothetical protein
MKPDYDMEYKFTLGDTVKNKSGLIGRIIGQARYPYLHKIEVRIKFPDRPKTMYRDQDLLELVKKSNWREDESIDNKYITDKGYEVYVEDATDENTGNPNGKYEITLWMARGGNYESLGVYKTFKRAVKEMEIWVSDNPRFGDE